MTSVTVDLEDLEALVLTTGALKTIEGALQARKSDPFVRPHLEFTAAHDRLAGAMRNARRAEAGTAVAWDEPLSGSEMVLLLAVYRAVDVPFELLAKDKAPGPKESMSTVDRLAAKGCVEIGQRVTGQRWSGKDPVLRLDTTCYIVRLTDRGREKLANIAQKEKING